MTTEQRTALREVVSGPRGKVPSPMVAWVRNPELARRAQQLGEVLRFATTLEDRSVELAILVCARHWTAHQVWISHVRHARKAGLEDAVIAALAAGRRPGFASEREEVVFDLSRCLLRDGRIPAAAYERGSAVLGERGVVELVALVGYYCLVGLTANAFELGIPENVAPELSDPERLGAR